MVVRRDHRSRTQEQARLEKRVRHQVEHRRHEGPHTGPQEHVAELRDRRVGQHLLDVVLDQADGGGHDRGRAADHRHGEHGGRTELIEEGLIASGQRVLVFQTGHPANYR